MSTTHVPVRYIGKAPKKRDNVCRSGLEWPCRGFVVENVPADIAMKLVQYRDVWVEADSDADLFKGQPFTGLKTAFSTGDGVPVTDEERIVDAARLIESLGGQELAMRIWSEGFPGEDQTSGPSTRQVVSLGNDLDDAIASAFNIMVGSDPEKTNGEYFVQSGPNKGKPKVEKIAELVGSDKPMSAEARDDAWEKYLSDVEGHDTESSAA